MNKRLHMLRITLEAKTRVSVGSGEIVERTKKTKKKAGSISDDTVEAAAIIRDANGLPALPGGSVQGVLSRLHRETFGCEATEALFGFERSDGTGRAGVIIFSWGAVHDSENRAVVGPENVALRNDPVIGRLIDDRALWRDHVALNAQHSVDGRKKFARISVPKGTRFSLEMTAWGDNEIRVKLIQVARLFRHERFRIGGAKGRGYGRVVVVSASYACPPLENPTALRDIRRQPPSTPLPEDILDQPEFARPDSDATTARVIISFPDGVRIGGGEAPADSPLERRDNTLWSLREVQFTYDSQPIESVVLPFTGSEVRGTLAHRMAYYMNAADPGRRIAVDDFLKLTREQQNEQFEVMAHRPAALTEFLGSAKEKRKGSATKSEGRAGRLLVSDTELTGATEFVMDHVSIDRLSGGARDMTGVLFAEELMIGATAEIELTIQAPIVAKAVPTVGGWEESTATVFLKALRDLCTGRLPIGARSIGAGTGDVGFSGRHEDEWRAKAKVIGVPLASGGQP